MQTNLLSEMRLANLLDRHGRGAERSLYPRRHGSAARPTRAQGPDLDPFGATLARQPGQPSEDREAVFLGFDCVPSIYSIQPRHRGFVKELGVRVRGARID